MDAIPYKPVESRDVLPDLKSSKLAGYGLAIIVSTWIVFIAGIISMIRGWYDLQIYVDDYTKYENETGYPIPLYYTTLIFLFPVILWIWSLISWMGMKFFRHAGRGVNTL
jgi:hypothetical protein